MNYFSFNMLSEMGMIENGWVYAFFCKFVCALCYCGSTTATSIHFRPCLAFVLIMLKYVCMYIFPFSVRTYTFLVRFPCCCFWLVIKPFSSSFFNNGYRTP